MKKVIPFYLGQSLIEIVIALGIIVVVLVGVSDLISRSLSLASYQATKNQATNIAQDQLSYFKHEKELAPTDFFLRQDVQSGNGDCDNTANIDSTKFVCKIQFEYIYDGSMKINGVIVTASVTWKKGNDEVTTKLSQTLAKQIK